MTVTVGGDVNADGCRSTGCSLNGLYISAQRWTIDRCAPWG